MLDLLFLKQPLLQLLTKAHEAQTQTVRALSIESDRLVHFSTFPSSNLRFFVLQ